VVVDTPPATLPVPRVRVTVRPPAPKPVVAKPAPQPLPVDEVEIVEEVVDEVEVLDDAPPPRPAKVVPKPAGEVLDLDDDRRPARRRRDKADDADDRSRSRRRDRDDDYEDDDRGRRKRRRDDDDYDDGYDDYPDRRSDKGAPYRRGAVGVLLIAISFWIYLGVFGFLTLTGLVLWTSDKLSEGLLVVSGILGIGNWVVAAVGVGFLIAGPAKARGLAIAAAILCLVHLIFLIVCFVKVKDATGGLGLFGSSGLEWFVMASDLLAVDLTLPVLFYWSKIFGEAIFFVLAGGFEVARLILLVLAVRAAADVTKGGGEAAGKGLLGVLIAGITIAASAVAWLLAIIIIEEGKLSASSRKSIMGVTFLLTYLAYTLMLIVPALAAHQTRAALARRGRR
jgi:hypothetical protein